MQDPIVEVDEYALMGVLSASYVQEMGRRCRWKGDVTCGVLFALFLACMMLTPMVSSGYREAFPDGPFWNVIMPVCLILSTVLALFKFLIMTRRQDLLERRKLLTVLLQIQRGQAGNGTPSTGGTLSAGSAPARC